MQTMAATPQSELSASAALDGQSPNGDFMPYTCQACAKRKVKCDKAAPICSTCSKSNHECVYQAPAPRRRKRKLSGDLQERVAQYEQVLKKHNLLATDATDAENPNGSCNEAISLSFMESETSKTGKVVLGPGKSRYVDSSLWRTLGEDELRNLHDEYNEDQGDSNDEADDLFADPLSAAFLGIRQDTFHFHPQQAHSQYLWKTFVGQIDPICKVLHVPTTSKMIDRISEQPQLATKAEECLAFAIYHFAVFSMDSNDCTEKLGQPRDVLLKRFSLATRCALVNASFLKTTQMLVLQALILLLNPTRHTYDSQTYWILTGVMVRIAQRMGLHRDGQEMKLPPFEIEMRRRAFYQLVPLDGMASKMSGTGIGLSPNSFNTEAPSNVNDDQIWPGMTVAPKEQDGPTDMMFCLARASFGKYVGRALQIKAGSVSGEFNDASEVEPLILEAQREAEDRFVRHCDFVDPVHFLTAAHVRAATTAMRLRVRLPKVRNKTVSIEERKEIFQLSQKILDTDIAVYGNSSLKKFLWYGLGFFAWGSWDALIFTLTTLWKPDILTSEEVEAAWVRITKLHDNHPQLLFESREPLQIAIRRLVLKAWGSVNEILNQGQIKTYENGATEPEIVIKVREGLQRPRDRSRIGRQDSSMIDPALSSVDFTPTPSEGAYVDMIPGMNANVGDGGDIMTQFDLNAEDWAFWDTLMQTAG